MVSLHLQYDIRNVFKTLNPTVMKLKSKHLHLNNHRSSKQDQTKFAVDLFNAIFDGTGTITFTVDDGDGDVWKYTIDVDVEHLKAVTQIKEN